jgi:GNAT superfamily N-acetyltransferase
MISIAGVQDAKELNMLINSAYRGEESKKGWTTEAEILGGIRMNEATLREMIEAGIGTIIKYTKGEQILATVYLEVKTPALYLGMFAVSPHSQGMGIGKELLNFAESFAREHGCDRITLTVIRTRLELIAWYERHGYEPTGNSIDFEDIEGRFGDPKVDNIDLIEMQHEILSI